MAKEKTAKKSTGGGKVMVEGLLTEDGLAKKLSPYNKFVKTEIAKMKSEKPGLGHQEAFKMVAKKWKESPENPKNKK